MEPSWSRRLFVAALGCAATVRGRNAGQCVVCGRSLPPKYWIYQDQACCSESCADRLKPCCSLCGKTVGSDYISSDDKIYCSSNCFERTLPACDICRTPIKNGYSVTRHNYCQTCFENNPACFSCGLPAAFPTRLDDGREICATCMRWSVNKMDMAQRHFDRALRQLEAWTSLELNSVPALVLVNRADMQELSKNIRQTDSPVSIRGLYSRQITTTKHLWLGISTKTETDVEERIYIVDHLHDAVFRTAATHELMHDMLQEHFPRLETAPLWVQEGICQQAAAEYCHRRNYADILYGIEHCTDPEYGDGFRYIRKVAGMNGWSALRRWMQTVDVAALPGTAPKQISKSLSGPRPSLPETVDHQ